MTGLLSGLSASDGERGGLVDFSSDVPFAMRLPMVMPTLLKSEAAVAAFFAESPDAVVDFTAQEVADAAGVSRATVIRTCQSLGYRGYPQLRVGLARELSRDEVVVRPAEGALGTIQAMLDEVARSVPFIASALSDETLDAVVDRLLGARRIVCAANGFSGAVALDLAMRLAAMGVPAEFVADSLAQQFTAAQLSADDCCFLVSATGQNELTLRTAELARNAGATVIALTSSPRSELAARADLTVVAAPIADSFRQELEQTSRIAQVVLVEALVRLVIERMGDGEAASRRARIVPVIAANLSD